MSLLGDLRRIPPLVGREWGYYRRRLRGCSLEPTYRCNLRCKMCGVHTLAGPGDKARELTRGEMLKIVDELAEMGASWLQLIGGEPLLRAEDMLAVISRGNAKGIQTTVITNGALIGEDLAREIVRARLQRLIFSVDGIGEVHDRVRGLEGAFERTCNGMRLVLEERRRQGAAFPVVEIQSTFSRLNCDQAEALVRFREEIGADKLVFLYVSEIPQSRLDATRLDGEPLCTQRWAPGETSCLFGPEELKRFRGALERVPADKAVRVFKALDDDAYLRCVFPTRCCYFMRSVLIINPFGDAYPCPHLDAYVTGNVCEVGVKGVWQNERHRKVIDGLREGMYPVCASCCVFGQNLTPMQAVRVVLGKSLK